MESHDNDHGQQQQDVAFPAESTNASFDWRTWTEDPVWADPPYMFEERLSEHGKLLRMHCCCVLSKFLLLFRTAGFKEVKKLNLLLYFLLHLSKVVFREVSTRGFEAEDKFNLKVWWIPELDHRVTAVNIVLFLVRRGYISVGSVVPRYLLKYEWKLDVVDKAIKEQEEALLFPEDESGAWILCHFLESNTACEHLLKNPDKIASNAVISEALIGM
jgi:hypothetical protein